MAKQKKIKPLSKKAPSKKNTKASSPARKKKSETLPAATGADPAEKILQLQHQHYADLLKKAPAFICILKGTRHVFEMANEEFLRLKPQQPMIGKAFEDVFPELKAQGYMALLDSILRNGIPFYGTELLLQIDQAGNQITSDIYVNFSFQPYRSATDRAEGIFVFGTDVTYQVSARKKIQEHNERYHYVTKATYDAIWDWDLLTDTVVWGEGFQTLLGYDLQKLKSDSTAWKDHIHPEDAERVIIGIKNTHASTHNNWSDEYRYQKSNGAYVYVKNRGIVIRDKTGKAIRMVGAMQDITHQKIEEQEAALLNDVGQIFSHYNRNLAETIRQTLTLIRGHGHYDLVEVWLLSNDQTKLKLAAKLEDHANLKDFYQHTHQFTSFKKGEGLPGKVWETKEVHHWKNPDQKKEFVRRDAAKALKLISVTGVPLIYGQELVGVLVTGKLTAQQHELINPIFKGFAEHLAAEIKRKQLEDELQQIFSTCPDIIAIVGPEGRFTKVNPAFCRLLGYTEEELTLSPFTKFIYQDDITDSQKEYVESISGQRNVTGFINRYVTKSGNLKWIYWNTAPLSGEENYMYAYGRDITEQKGLEDLLNNASQLARIGGWEVNMETGKVSFSKLTREIHEVDDAFVPTLESGISFYRKDVQDQVKAHVAAAIETGKSWDFELPIITAKGNERWIRSIGNAEFKKGKCVRFYGSFQDIDQRKRAETKATEVLQEKNIILERITEAFFAVDKNWKVTYWNSKAEEILMHSKQQMLGNHLWEVFTTSVDSFSYQQYHQALATNEAVHFEDYHPPLHRWYEVNAYPSESGLSVYFKDVTERKQSELELRQLNEKLQEHAKELARSNAELEQFAYVASHDLQEPLRMVSSFLSQLEKKYESQLDDRARQYIFFAVDGAKRMRQIIMELLDFSRMGRVVLEKETVDLNSLVKEIIDFHRSMISEKKAQITYSKLPVLVSAKSPLRQVFSNLINNALKYHKPDKPPFIEITTKDEQDHWLFAVRDNGIGIDENYFDRIFVLFQRLHSKSEYAGSGLGLAICRKIIEALGGRIWVESKEGYGSTFFFTLPKK